MGKLYFWAKKEKMVTLNFTIAVCGPCFLIAYKGICTCPQYGKREMSRERSERIF